MARRRGDFVSEEQITLAIHLSATKLGFKEGDNPQLRQGSYRFEAALADRDSRGKERPIAFAS